MDMCEGFQPMFTRHPFRPHYRSRTRFPLCHRRLLKEGSSDNSLALRRSNNPLTAIPVKNKMILNEIP